MTGVLKGKVALVTGAGVGIGLATSWAFAEAGASVVLADRDEQALGKGTEEIRAAGYNALGLQCDVTDKAQVTRTIERAVATYGRLDAAFNNASVNSDGASLLDTSDEEFERIINVNLRGVWNCMKAELRHVVAQGRQQARGHRADTIRRARVRHPGNSHQRGLPWHGQHPDGSRRHEELRS